MNVSTLTPPVAPVVPVTPVIQTPTPIVPVTPVTQTPAPTTSPAPAAQYPGKVTSILITSITDSLISFSWNRVGGNVARYMIRRDGAYQEGTTALDFTDTGLQSSYSYEYAVCSESSTGLRTCSTPFVATTRKARVVSINASTSQSSSSNESITTPVSVELTNDIPPQPSFPSAVAHAVQEMVKVAERNGEVGQEIKTITQAQAQNHEKLETNLQKIQNRDGFARFFIGPDYGKIKESQILLEQNKEQIQKLNQLEARIIGQEDQQKIVEQIQLLGQATQQIENILNETKNGFSLFGWIFRLFF